MINNLVVILTAILMAIVLFSKRMRKSTTWRATVTPLASIIGSGFLVSAPLLILTTGKFAPIAMLAIVIIAYALGSSIRYNICFAEPLLSNAVKKVSIVHHLEGLSRPILGLAYIISVAFYLKLLSAFALRGMGVSSILLENFVTTALLLLIGITGKIKGLSKLELLETTSVNIKLSIIVALILGHIYFNFNSLFDGTWELLPHPHESLQLTIQKLLGVLIIIQGFETSRYLRGVYTQELRVQTMKKAQIISGFIYVVFITSTLTAFNQVHSMGATTVIDVCRMVAPVLPFLLIIAAVMSQFSAAVADTLGSGGLLTEASRNKIKTNNSYLIITLAGVFLTWTTHIYTIITYASKAFAIYYALQLMISIAILINSKNKTKNYLLITRYSLLILLMILVVFFGIPVEE